MRFYFSVFELTSFHFPQNRDWYLKEFLGTVEYKIKHVAPLLQCWLPGARLPDDGNYVYLIRS
jgi:hypothetical protein